MSGTHTDITALKQAEAGLALERSRLYSLLAHLYTGVIMEDRDGRIAVCNRAFCELFPLVENPGELVGRRREEVLTEVRGQFDDGDAMLQRIDAI
ncbi:PAS domain-containing protein, partial [Acinetobacter baumannii]